MLTASLRERIQRCRGELNQLASLARDCERGGFEGGRFGAGGFRSEAHMDGWQRQGPGPLVRRCVEIADRCTVVLSEIEREVESAGFGRAGFDGTRGGWDREPLYRSQGWDGPRGDYGPYGSEWTGGSYAGAGTVAPRYGRELVGTSGRSYPRY